MTHTINEALVTVLLEGGVEWTMAVLEDGPEDGESEAAWVHAQLTTATNLVAEDGTVLYGQFGPARAYRGSPTAVVFSPGVRVLAAYKEKP